jgi:hypothetical protein
VIIFGLRRAALLVSAVGTLLLATALPAAAAGTVTPTLTCVFDNGDGTSTAVFGYTNTTGTAVTLPIGGSNNFAPSPQDRGQPTVFPPGSDTSAVLVVFDGSKQTWTLDAGKVHTTPSSPACPTDPSLPVSAGSPAGLSFLVGSTAVAAAFMGRRRVRPLGRRGAQRA